FFSSRRRHTRFSRDWSSDVCSSDLAVELRDEVGAVVHRELGPGREHRFDVAVVAGVVLALVREGRDLVLADEGGRGVVLRGQRRSEERRVGKEGQWRGRPGPEKKSG